MQVAPTIAHRQTGTFKKCGPLGKGPGFLPHVGLLSSGIESHAPRQEPRIRYKQNEYRVGLGDTNHLEQGRPRVEKMLQRAQTGNNVKLPILKRQLLGGSAVKIGTGK